MEAYPPGFAKHPFARGFNEPGFATIRVFCKGGLPFIEDPPGYR